MATSSLDIACNQLLVVQKALQGMGDTWPEAQPSPLWWDHYRRGFTTRNRTGTYRWLYGAAGALRGPTLRYRLGRARRVLSRKRWSGPYEYDFPVPADGVVLPGLHHNRVIVVSKQSRSVIKLVYGQQDVDREVEAWAIAQNAGMTHRLPRLISEGLADDNVRWMKLAFAPNTHPLHEPLNPFVDGEKLWRRWVRAEVLPTMQRFYEASEIEQVDADDLLEAEKELLLQSSIPDPLWQVIRLAECARPYRAETTMIRAAIHGDLKPEHIHRHNGTWRIIDWGKLGRMVVFWEVLAQQLRHPSHNHPGRRRFWAWLGGNLSFCHLAHHDRALLELFSDWQASWIGLRVDAASLRYQILVSLVKKIRESLEEVDLERVSAARKSARRYETRSLQRMVALGVPAHTDGLHVEQANGKQRGFGQ